ncbi:hypothetical protein [Rhizobium leguminosarum]|uniref:hypothetical protein n=1 Tax=Rhizobium leguminosarum TaxID=384 RepID=UPI0013AF2A18|nr:hypothetical protein [Rhizobium leguminosarum]
MLSYLILFLVMIHLEEQKFGGVPRFQGLDERNREILSFLPGNVPRDLDHFDDKQLSAAAALLRRFHDATVSLVRGEDGGTEAVREQRGFRRCRNQMTTCCGTP